MAVRGLCYTILSLRLRRSSYHDPQSLFLFNIFSNLTDYTFNDSQKQVIAQEIQVADWNAKSFSHCKDGIVYYSAPIPHFGNKDDTVWENGDPTYNNDNEKYLGRYGLVRNNKYNFNIKSVKQPGEPIIPPITDDPDDISIPYQLELQVTVKPWNKREVIFDF